MERARHLQCDAVRDGVSVRIERLDGQCEAIVVDVKGASATIGLRVGHGGGQKELACNGTEHGSRGHWSAQERGRSSELTRMGDRWSERVTVAPSVAETFASNPSGYERLRCQASDWENTRASNLEWVGD